MKSTIRCLSESLESVRRKHNLLASCSKQDTSVPLNTGTVKEPICKNATYCTIMLCSHGRGALFPLPLWKYHHCLSVQFKRLALLVGFHCNSKIAILDCISYFFSFKYQGNIFEDYGQHKNKTKPALGE